MTDPSYANNLIKCLILALCKLMDGYIKLLLINADGLILVSLILVCNKIQNFLPKYKFSRDFYLCCNAKKKCRLGKWQKYYKILYLLNIKYMSIFLFIGLQ